MIEKMELTSLSSPLWKVFILKSIIIIPIAIGIPCLITIYSDLFSIIGFSSFIVQIIIYILFTLLGLLMLIKEYGWMLDDTPSQWDNDICIDFHSKKLRINDDAYDFHTVYRIIANQYEAGIFPTYYKIWLEFKNGKREKFIALNDANKYTNLLKAFHEAGISVN